MKRLWKEISKTPFNKKCYNQGRSFASDMAQQVKEGGVIIILTTFIIYGLTGCQKKSNNGWPCGDKPVFEYKIDKPDKSSVTDTSTYRPSGYNYDHSFTTSNSEDEYNDSLDYYLDDPEDELRFDPEIFDFQDD